MDWILGTIIITLVPIGLTCLYQAYLETITLIAHYQADLDDIRLKTWKLIANGKN